MLAFQLAARGAFKEGITKAGPRLLEPVMKVRRGWVRGLRGAGGREGGEDGNWAIRSGLVV